MRRKKVALRHVSMPDGIALYIFGSCLKSETPNDIDLIIIYDKNIYQGSTIFKICAKMLEEVSDFFNLPIHTTYLSQEEEHRIDFIKKVGAELIVNKFHKR